MPGDSITTVLQLVLINETGDSYYRMRWPGAQLAEQDSSWRVINLDARAQERFQLALHADLLVLYQSNDVDVMPLIVKRRELGKKTLVEYNDNFYAPHPASPVAEEWGSPLLWRTYEHLMELADGVIVTGPGLKKLFSQKVDNDFYILENHLPQTPPPFEQVWADTDDEIRIGWGGSIGHIADFLALVPVLVELANEFSTLKICLMGNEAIRQHLPLPDDRVAFTPWGGMQEYFSFWRPIHAGIIPLLDTPYNRCRSDVKALEMSSLGVLPLLPNALPYKEFIKQAEIEPYKDLADAKAKLKAYLKNPKQMREDAKVCYEYVVTQRVGLERRERHELYRQFLPEQISDFNWPMGPGYYEVQGNQQPQTISSAVMQRAQQHLEAKQVEQGQQLLDNSVQNNTHDPSLALSRIKFLRATKNEQLLPELQKSIEQFPDDLRFRMLELVYQPNEETRKATWDFVIKNLGSAPEPAKQFYQKDFIKLAARELAHNISATSTLQKLLKVYPQSARLHFALGEAYVRNGEDSKALAQYRWLTKEFSQHSQNVDFFKEVQRSYLASWEEGLRVRSKKKKKKK